MQCSTSKQFAKMHTVLPVLQKILTYNMHQAAWKFPNCFSTAPKCILTKTHLCKPHTTRMSFKVLKEIRQMAKVEKFGQFHHVFHFVIIFLNRCKSQPFMLFSVFYYFEIILVSFNFNLWCCDVMLYTHLMFPLKGLGHTICGNFSTDQIVVELT